MQLSTEISRVAFRDLVENGAVAEKQPRQRIEPHNEVRQVSCGLAKNLIGEFGQFIGRR